MELENIISRLDPAEGWNDIFLKITDQKENIDSIIYSAKGVFEGKIVGLNVEVKKGMAAGLLLPEEINQNAFYRDGISFFSIGTESDELIKAISKLYQFPTTKSFSQSITDIVVFSLNQTPVNLNTKEFYKFKMFFHDDSEDLYCEMFCNINLIENVIEFREKDEEYRENIIKALTS